MNTGTIGLLGGMSWVSTLDYYRIINEAVASRLGGLHSARILMYSFDFEDLVPLQAQGLWDEAAEKLIAAGRSLERAGADFLVIGCNTMHASAEAIEAAVDLPLLHIADAAADRLKAEGVRRAGLLGTRFTMEGRFIAGRLRERHGLDVILPSEGDRQIVHDVIYRELCVNAPTEASRSSYRRVIRRMADDGAEAVILGCTEIRLLVSQDDSPIPLIDTTTCHALAAAERSLSGF